MKPNEMEQVERKYAELEFGIRQKEQKIRQAKNYHQIQEKLKSSRDGNKGADDCCLDLIALKDDLEELHKILKEEELVNQQLEQVQQRLDTYYGLPGQKGRGGEGLSSEFDEKLYAHMIDEQTKIIVTTQMRQPLVDPKK